jgi:hypothetical protein
MGATETSGTKDMGFITGAILVVRVAAFSILHKFSNSIQRLCLHGLTFPELCISPLGYYSFWKNQAFNIPTNGTCSPGWSCSSAADFIIQALWWRPPYGRRKP